MLRYSRREQKFCSIVAGVMNNPQKSESKTDAIPLVEEEVVVEKHNVVTGRVRVRTITEIHRHTQSETIEVPVTRRKQRVVVERIPQVKEK